MTLFLALGLLGSILILIGFILNEFGKLLATNWRYDMLNAIGGGLLLAYAIQDRAWPFVLLNGVWTLVALRDLIKGKKPSSKAYNNTLPTK